MTEAQVIRFEQENPELLTVYFGEGMYGFYNPRKTREASISIDRFANDGKMMRLTPATAKRMRDMAQGMIDMMGWGENESAL